MNSLGDIWKQVLALCKNDVSDVMYTMWLEPLQFYKLDGETAVFTVNADFKKNIILSKFSELLKKNFESVIGFSVEIDVIVNQAADEKDNDAPKTAKEEKKEEEKKTEPENEPEKTGPVKKNASSFTFDNFVVGQSNMFAYEIAKKVAASPGVHNPFLIYGNSGLGKTHLLYAIYNELKRKDPAAIIIYETAEKFLSEFMNSLNTKNTQPFKNKYRNVDALLIDDIQMMRSGQSTQEEFFHTFNTLHQAGKQIVLTSDVPPKDLLGFDERLKTRFEMGLIADIQNPDIETRKNIVKNKSRELGITLSDSATDYIASNIKNNIRQIEGTLNKVEAYTKVYNRALTFDEIKTIVNDVIHVNLPIDDIVKKTIDIVSEIYGITPEEITSKSRTQTVSTARNVCMYVIKALTGITLNETGKIFGKNHSTVINSIANIEKEMNSNQKFRSLVNDILRQVKETI